MQRQTESAYRDRPFLFFVRGEFGGVAAVMQHRGLAWFRSAQAEPVWPSFSARSYSPFSTAAPGAVPGQRVSGGFVGQRPNQYAERERAGFP